ncbi:DUF1648 domain-containing protein [Carnobacterium gallinarum]|uniref:DUF1648 domain-containing protein n=1 Tax=Carnobacterium gallinarum TaxID=2749 RepID=UPI000550B670|nr:DUF5808 domain-containing protein [Carnobacterium gallinarum]
MIEFAGLMSIIIIFVGVSSGVTPYFNRSSQFGVTLPEKYQNNSLVKTQQKKFLWVNILLGIILAVPIIYFIGFEDAEKAALWISFYLLFALVVFFTVTSILFLTIRKKIMNFKAELPVSELELQDLVIDTNYRHRKLIVPSYFILLTNLLIIVLVVAITFVNYDRIPHQIVTHWTIDMQPDRMTTKTIFTILYVPIIQVFMMGIFYLSNYSFQKAKQKIDPRHPEVSVEKNRAFRYAWSVFMLILSIAVQLLMAVIQLVMIFNWMDKINFPLVLVLFFVLILGGSIYLSFKYGQSGERFKVRNATDSETKTVSGYDDDASWKMGAIYFNPKDPSVWVEKRFGIGITMNMARWQTWCFLLGLLCFPIMITLLFM